MKVIFLDFDGVLNSVASMIWNNRQKLLGLSDTPSHKSFCPISCSNFQYVLEEVPDVQVVVSSTWRKYNKIDALKKIFEQNHLIPERMIGTTPVLDGYRGAEIDAYLKDHPEITTFVIIDDDSDMKPYMDRLVKTDSRVGFTFVNADKVIEMLGGASEEESKG